MQQERITNLEDKLDQVLERLLYVEIHLLASPATVVDLSAQSCRHGSPTAPISNTDTTPLGPDSI